MTAELYAALVRVHGHLAWLGVAVLLHPVITLRVRAELGRWTRLTADLGALGLAAPFVLGWTVYPAYRTHPKRELLAHAPAIAAAFESKEHLAAFAVVLAFAGAVTLHAVGREPVGRRLAWALLASGWGCAVLTAIVGVTVAVVAHPAW